MVTEKRESSRVPIPGELRGEVMVFQPMSVLDVGLGGVQIETAFPLQLDSLHEFRLSLGERSIVVKGRVARCHVGELTQEGVRYRSGIEFVEPSEHAAAALRGFVEHLQARMLRPAVIDAEIEDE